MSDTRLFIIQLFFRPLFATLTIQYYYYWLYALCVPAAAWRKYGQTKSLASKAASSPPNKKPIICQPQKLHPSMILQHNNNTRYYHRNNNSKTTNVFTLKVISLHIYFNKSRE